MIHVCYCFCDKTGHYAKFAGTSILSMLENTGAEITVHILHDNTLTSENIDRFNYLVGRYNQYVKFYNLDELFPDKIDEIKRLVPDVEKSKVTVGAFYKLLIPQALPNKIEKAIFIDPDTIVNLDIKELWQIDLEDKLLGVVPEVENGANPTKSFLLCSEGFVKSEDYFNTGVFLMNLNALRGEEKKIMQGVKFRGENLNQKYFEQTVLNYCFSTQTLKLPTKFNRFVRQERSQSEQVIEKKIYHYSDGSSRMGLDMNDIFNRLWMDYFIKTPWFDEKTMEQLYIGLQKIRNDLKDSTLRISKALMGKTRVFFVEPAKEATIKKAFAVDKDEIIIPAENNNSIQKLLNAMKVSKGKSVFFIMTEKILNKPFPLDQLKKEGFSEGKNFLKGWKYLPTKRGVPFSSYALVKAL